MVLLAFTMRMIRIESVRFLSDFACKFVGGYSAQWYETNGHRYPPHHARDRVRPDCVRPSVPKRVFPHRKEEHSDGEASAVSVLLKQMEVARGKYEEEERGDDDGGRQQ